MKGLKKRVENLEQTHGEGNWVYLTVYRTDDGRFRYNRQVYADTDAVREAAGIPPDTMVYFIHWLFDMNPDEKSCLHKENRMVKEAAPEHIACPPAVCNPFIKPVTPVLTSEPQFAEAASTVWGRMVF